MTSIDTYVEMFLKPVSTGIYDWTTVPAPQHKNDVVVSDGNRTLNADPGVPNRLLFTVKDSAGNFNRKNPMGAYYGSIGLGVQTRCGVWRVDDQFGRTETNTWGAVGNVDGDVWTNGSSTGGVVAATDWTVSAGAARHSIPAAGAYRWSELSKATKLFDHCEARLRVKVPTANVTGTGALSTEVWMRTVDVSNNVVVSVAWQTDETVQIALADKVAGASRYLLNYTTITGLNLATTGVDYDIRCQVEGSTVRAKVWAVGSPEPIGWQVYGYGATMRKGYCGVATFCFTGNTNAKPLEFQYDMAQFRIPMFAGETTDLTPSGDGKSTAKMVAIECAGMMDRLQSNSAPAESVMRRSRSRSTRWLKIAVFLTATGTVRTMTMPTANIGTTTVGDFFYLSTPSTGLRKEDTLFTVTASSVAGANTTLTFTPDARDAVAGSDLAESFRGLSAADQPIAYWPGEDGSNATQVASGLVGGTPLSITGTVDFASESGFLASKPILKINNAELRAIIPEYTTSAAAISFNFLLTMPTVDEAATGSDLIQFYTSGTGFSYDLRYTGAGGGSFQLTVANSALTVLFDSGQIDFTLRGNKQMVCLVLEQVGATVTYRLFTIRLPGSITGGTGPNVVTGVTTLGQLTDFRVNPAGGYVDVGYGHMTIVPGIWSSNEVEPEFIAWTGANAIRRYSRLAWEEDIPITFREDWDVVASNVGPQKVNRVVDLLKEPAYTDGGFLHGMRGAYALEYITRGALTNQTAKAVFSAQDCKDLELLADFVNIQNRVSVTRIDGTTAIAEKTTGPLSTQDAPNGIGLRDEAYQLSLGADSAAQNHAYWRLGVGTIDEYRVPLVVVTSAGLSSITLETLLSLGIGDRIDITGLSSMGVYDTLPQLVVGVRVYLGNRFYPKVELTCVPYSVFRTLAITADQYARVDAVDTSTGSTLTTTATGSLTLTSGSNFYLWTTDATDFPLDVMILGERITLSAIADTASPGVQTATISARSVNGVVKTHSVGEEVVIAEPNYWQFR